VSLDHYHGTITNHTHSLNITPSTYQYSIPEPKMTVTQEVVREREKARVQYQFEMYEARQLPDDEGVVWRWQIDDRHHVAVRNEDGWRTCHGHWYPTRDALVAHLIEEGVAPTDVGSIS